MGFGLRKPKSEKDIKGKLRKPPKVEESTVSRHQRIPSTAPVLPVLPSHISRSAVPSSVDPHIPYSPLQLRDPCQKRPLPKSHAHRRSRSFSALASFITPSSGNDQPWRSRDAWLAIHSRSPSPPPTSRIPSAKDGTDGGWRRRGNGGFFARELAGVGDAVLALPHIRPGAGAGRSHTSNDIIRDEVDKPNLQRRASETCIPDIQEKEASEWKPGFATSLFRQKTQRVKQEQLQEEPPSRPESVILPNNSSTPPPSFRRQRSTVSPGTIPNPTTRVTSSSSMSIRTSQSSSIHTYDSNDHDPAMIASVDQYTSPRSSSARSDFDGLPKRKSSLGSRVNDLPTIITPTTTYFHFSPGRSVPKRIERRPSATEQTGKIPIHQTTGPIRYPSPHPGVIKASKVYPQYSHSRDESLPALLPPATIGRAIPDLARPSIGNERMKGVSWARAQRPEIRVMDEGGEGYISGIDPRRESQSPPTRRLMMERVAEMEDGLRGMSVHDSRWSKGTMSMRRGSGAREMAKGGWI